MSIYKTPNDLSQSLAADPKSMASLTGRMANDPKGAVREVSQQFEAMFMNTLLKSMRETHFSDDDQSSEMQTYRGLLDQQMVQSLTSGSGLGLSKMLEQQISKLAHIDDDSSGALPSSQVQGSLPALSPRMLRAYQEIQAQAAGRKTAAMDAASEAVNAGASTTTSSSAQAGSESGVASGNARSFVHALLPHAANAGAQLGVAPEVLVAHAALESGWGKRAIRNVDGSDSHNLFGIKAGASWRGATANVLTTEYVNGVAQKKVDSFRAYGSYQEAFADYANLLSSSPRYRNVMNQGRNIQGFAQGLQSGGYATDPRYAHKLIDVMSSLAQFSA